MFWIRSTRIRWLAPALLGLALSSVASCATLQPGVTSDYCLREEPLEFSSEGWAALEDVLKIVDPIGYAELYTHIGVYQCACSQQRPDWCD